MSDQLRPVPADVINSLPEVQAAPTIDTPTHRRGMTRLQKTLLKLGFGAALLTPVACGVAGEGVNTQPSPTQKPVATSTINPDTCPIPTIAPQSGADAKSGSGVANVENPKCAVDILTQLDPWMQLVLSNPDTLTNTQKSQRDSYIKNFYSLELNQRISTFSNAYHPLKLGILADLGGTGMYAIPSISKDGGSLVFNKGKGGYGVLLDVKSSTGNDMTLVAMPLNPYNQDGQWIAVPMNPSRTAYLGRFPGAGINGASDFATIINYNNEHVIKFALVTNPDKNSRIRSNSEEVVNANELLAYMRNPQAYLKDHNGQKPPFVFSSEDLANPNTLAKLQNMGGITPEIIEAYL